MESSTDRQLTIEVVALPLETGAEPLLRLGKTDLPGGSKHALSCTESMFPKAMKCHRQTSESAQPNPNLKHTQTLDSIGCRVLHIAPERLSKQEKIHCKSAFDHDPSKVMRRNHLPIFTMFQDASSRFF